MIKLLASVLLVVAACGGSKSTGDTTPPTGGEGEPTVDPTLPSWLPENCVAYHKAVVGALGCEGIEQDKRDEIQAEFGAASEGWKAQDEADTATIEETNAACETKLMAVHAATSGNCIAADAPVTDGTGDATDAE